MAEKKEKIETPAPAAAPTAPKAVGRDKDSNLLAAIAYLLGFFAIIIYFIKKDDRFLRFHSLQATIYSVAWFVVFMGFFILSAIISAVTMGLGGICFFFLPLLGLAVFVGMIYAAYKAFEGEMWEMPVIGSMARKYV